MSWERAPSACWRASGWTRCWFGPDRVVVIATGTELVDPGLSLSDEQQIFDSNSYLLAAAAEQPARRFPSGSGGDDRAALKRLISDQLIRADLILTTGGVSQATTTSSRR